MVWEGHGKISGQIPGLVRLGEHAVPRRAGYTFTGDKGSQRLYLGFLPLPGKALLPRPFTAPKLQQFAGTILLNGYVGNNLARAKDIERVINTRRA